MPKTVVHMIGQAHLDPVWLWRWNEGRAEALATSQSAVDRLAETPEFHFTRGESQVYQWIEEEDPALFERILALIRAGRWHVVNGMVIQPDMNLPQGESFVRQVLLGKRTMQARLGVEPRVAYCVDSFGHAGTLPQVLRKCGFDHYVFMRPGPHEKELPAQVFWWQAPDGSRILTFRIAGAYTTRTVDHAQHIANAVAAKPPELDHVMCFFGVGNHGGGPTRAQIENVQALAATRDDLEIRFSWPDAYFAAIAADAERLPVVAEELQFHAVGCYSVNSALKRAHRKAECRLLVAERMAVLAAEWSGRPAPASQLDALWQTLCFNQFHDTLGGSSIKEAEDDAISELGGVVSAAERLIDDAGRAVAARIDTSGRGGTVVIFNPSGQATTQFVEYEPWTDWESWQQQGYGLVDDAGHPVNHQVIETHEALTHSRHGLTRIVFRADVPAMGFRLYRFTPGAVATAQQPGRLSASPTVLENDRLRVTFDASNGAIISCIDLLHQLEIVGSAGWNVAQVLEDTSDTWSHGIRGYCGQLVGIFGAASIKVVDYGPLQASVLIERSHAGNRWLQQIILRLHSDEILIRNWLSWHGQWRIVKLAFDVATATPTAVHDVPFGWCVRPADGAEVPTQMWMDVSGPATGKPTQVIGAALLNDGKYGCDVNGSTMRLTVLRCPPYAFHEPHAFGVKSRYDWVDQGDQEFDLVIRPHVGDWHDAQIVEAARRLNLPIVPITMHSHMGDLPAHASLLELDSTEMELTALKAAEDGDGYIVRVADRHGRGGSGNMHWRNERFPIGLQPFEVGIWRIHQRGGRWQMAACDMIERVLSVAST
jgi:alpha-mannosidase